MESIYSYPEIDVPENLRKYLRGRGHLFHAYTKQLELDDMGFNVSVDQFLEKFPSWEEVLEDEAFSDDEMDSWKQEDHSNFKKLLEWCVESGFDYHIGWSY